MISGGRGAELDLSLELYGRCKQVTFCMLPGFRDIMEELVDDQKGTADRVKMVRRWCAQLQTMGSALGAAG